MGAYGHTNGAYGRAEIPWTVKGRWVPPDDSAIAIPFVGISELAELSENYTTVLVAPHDGYLERVMLWCHVSMGAACGLELFTGTNQLTVVTSAGTEITKDTTGFPTPVTYDFGRAYSFSRGDFLKLVCDPSADASGNGTGCDVIFKLFPGT